MKSSRGTVCEENEGIRAMTAEAAEKMVAAALAFQQDVAMRKGDEATVSSTRMRMAMVRCISLNNLWMQLAQNTDVIETRQTMPAGISG